MESSDPEIPWRLTHYDNDYVPPADGGCWVCNRDDPDPESFDMEFDTHYHERCLRRLGLDSIVEFERGEWESPYTRLSDTEKFTDMYLRDLRSGAPFPFAIEEWGGYFESSRSLSLHETEVEALIEHLSTQSDALPEAVEAWGAGFIVGFLLADAAQEAITGRCVRCGGLTTEYGPENYFPLCRGCQ